MSLLSIGRGTTTALAGKEKIDGQMLLDTNKKSILFDIPDGDNLKRISIDSGTKVVKSETEPADLPDGSVWIG